MSKFGSRKCRATCGWCNEFKRCYKVTKRILWPDGGWCCQDCIIPASTEAMKKSGLAAEKARTKVKVISPSRSIVTPSPVPHKPPKRVVVQKHPTVTPRPALRGWGSVGPCSCHSPEEPSHADIDVPTGEKRSVGQR